MLDTLVEIGKCIKNDEIGRIKYHPLISEISKYNKDSNKYGYKKYYLVNINTTKKTLDVKLIEGKDSKVKYLKIKTSGSDNNNTKYSIGSFIMDKESNSKGKIKTKDIITYYLTNIKDSFNLIDFDNDDIKNYHNIINSNISEFENINFEHNDVVEIVIDGKEFEEYIVDYLDIVDNWYIDNITDENGYLNKSIFSFFKPGKSLSQSPNFKNYNLCFSLNKVQLTNVIYSKYIFNNNYRIIDNYQLLVLPISDNYNYKIIDNYLQGNNIFKYINNYEDNMDEINDDFVYYDSYIIEKGQNTDSIIKRYPYFDKNIILKNLKNIIRITKELKYNGWYSYLINDYSGMSKLDIILNLIFDGCHYIKMDKIIKKRILFLEKLKNNIDNKEEYNNSINFKFMIKMGKETNEKKILEDKSYQLGLKVGKYCVTNSNDRKNLEQWEISKSAIFSRILKNRSDIVSYLVEYNERLKRNNCWKDVELNKSIDIDLMEIEDINMSYFLLGYHESFNSIKYKKIEKKEDIEENNN
jgi:hypothetical protein